MLAGARQELTVGNLEGHPPLQPGDLAARTAGARGVKPPRLWRALQRVLRSTGLPAMPFHALRHTAATLLLAEGAHPRVVMELLGHSTIALTMDTYSHVIPALERDAADRMNRLLGGSG